MNFIKITRNQYKDLFDKTLFNTFFHNADWHEFLEKQFKWLKFEYFLYGDEAVLPIAKFKVFGIEKAVSLPFCEYGGSLLLKGNLNFEGFKANAFKEFGENTKIKFHPAILKFGGATSEISTHWIEDLKNTSEQEIWDSFRKTLRHEIKHAQEQNLVIKKCSNLEELKRFYDLYVANLRRKKTIPYPWALIQFLYKNASSELLLAFYEGKIIGGSLFIEYCGFVHYFLSASDYKYKNLGANYLILWEKIKSLIGQDIVLDLGATPKDSSLNVFKSGWGGKEYSIVVMENKKNFNDLRSSKLRNLFALLPNFVVRKLSPVLIKYRL